ncbi:HepT-like ribonuclease domain-containing protein [Ursidibacter sp. B-7004-1]
MSVDFRVPDYLDKIRSLCLDIQAFVEGMPLEDFLSDRRSENAVAMSLIAMGEIATVLSNKYPEFIEQHKHIPWRYMRGMRNVIAHGYFELDFVVVYETAITSVSELLTQIEALILETQNKR